MKNRKKKVIRSLLSIPVWLLIDALAIFAALWFDANVLPNPQAIGHPTFAVTILAAAVFGAITALVLVIAAVRLILWLILGND